MNEKKVRVYIICNGCGEKFTLRGKSKGEGHYGTGFKRCQCDNDKDFSIRTEKHL